MGSVRAGTEIRTQSAAGMYPLLAAILFCGMPTHSEYMETIVFQQGAEITRYTTQLPKTCWLYTWLGVETEKVNTTMNCRDMEPDTEDDEEKVSRPCFSPLVWTTNNEDGENQPDLDKIEATCEEVGCVPHCTPGTREMCIKYTEWSGDKMSYTSSFCGEVTLDWTGGRPSNDRCYYNEDNNKQYCYNRVEFCYQDGGNCNGVSPLSVSGVVLVLVIQSLYYIFLL